MKTLSKLLLIKNPKSGQGNSPLEEFTGLLEEKGLSLETRELSHEVTCDSLLEDAKNFDAVIAAGGDGTVSAVAYAMRNQGVPLFVFPAGTANLIAQNLNLPSTAPELLEVLLEGHTLLADLGELEVEGEKKGFAMIAGAGLDAALIKASEDLKPNFGAFAYVLGALKQLVPRTQQFKLTLDGQETTLEGASVMIANFGMANFRLPVTSGIDPADGLLTVVVLKGKTALTLLPTVIDSVRAKFNLGDPLFADHLETYHCKHIRVETTPELPIQYDGESLESSTPFEARVLPKAIRFFTRETREEVKT